MQDISMDLQNKLVDLVNNHIYNSEVYLEEYRKITFDIYNENILRGIMQECGFKEIGSVLDYPEQLPQPEVLSGYDISLNYDLFQRIAISEKFNAILYFTFYRYSIECTFLVDDEFLKKFSKKTKKILQQDSRANMFREVKLICKKGEYIEVSDSTGDTMKPADVVKKTVPKEKLIFNEDSSIVEVMNTINLFFRKETKEMYKEMELPYKRGIILHGSPGNGKSTMIREIIRTVPDVAKVVINPNVSKVTKILSSLVQSLEGKQAIVIIEDIDSLITDRNRSEFLNILDGVDIQSGVFFIGTTNYPDQIDPAFMNRPGRFDRTYEIGNPNEGERRAFFNSRGLSKLFKEFKIFNDGRDYTDEELTELFVANSENLPMAGLKEVLTGARYSLVSKPETTVEDAVVDTFRILTENKENHANSHEDFKVRRVEMGRGRRFRDDD